MTRRGWLLILGIGVAGVLLVVGLSSLIRSCGAPPKVRVIASEQASGPIKAAVSSTHSKNLLAQAESARAQGDSDQAQKLYNQLLEEDPQNPLAAKAQEQLGQVSLDMIFSGEVGPNAIRYSVKPGDTLSKIARKFKTTVELLKRSNGLEEDLIRVGQELKVTQARFNLIVDKSQNTLTLKDKDQVLKVYTCSTGKGGITPVGDFRIVSRLIDPAWKGLVPPGDPENPLGSRWLGFDLPQYGIHGTNEPESIGLPVTKGCIRLTNSDVEELFTLLPQETLVTVVE